MAVASFLSASILRNVLSTDAVETRVDNAIVASVFQCGNTKKVSTFQYSVTTFSCDFPLPLAS